MSKIKTALSLSKTPLRLVTRLGANGLINWMPDIVFVYLSYKGEMGEFPNLKNPKSFNEKLQWLKLYDRKPRYTDLVDKIKAKENIAKIIGEEHIVPLLGAWETFEEIEFEKLPDRFVLKCNHDQGSVFIVSNKDQFDVVRAGKFINRCLKRNLYPETREFPYKKMKPFVFAEEYLGECIVDYKFYCFNGEPRFLYCGQGLTTDHSLKIDFYDLDWNLMPFYRTDYQRLGRIEKPKHFDEMIEISKKLSSDVPFVRIDLFEVDDKVYFSEFTLCPASGFMPFEPKEFDMIVGQWLVLPNTKIL